MNKEEKQFNKALHSPYFHHSEKGCRIIDKLFKGEKNKVKGAFCKTHKADLCKCGWAWYKHYQYNLIKR